MTRRLRAFPRTTVVLLVATALLHGACVTPSPVSKTHSKPAATSRTAAVDRAGDVTPTSGTGTYVTPLPAPLPKAATRAPVAAPTSGLRGRTIIVDAGHGGTDPGAQSLSPVPEKTIVLSVAKELAARLRAAGADVVMTRTGDTYPSLDERAALADARPRRPADLRARRLGGQQGRVRRGRLGGATCPR